MDQGRRGVDRRGAGAARATSSPAAGHEAGRNGILDGIDLDSYAGDVRAAALREAQRIAPVLSNELDEAEFVTYGHIVIDEAQDLSPMELRVFKRRDLTGSMTIVGDMGQATTASSSASWNAVLEVLEPRRAPTRVDLTVSYRTPEEVLDFAAPTLCAAAPRLEPPRPVRRAGHAPSVDRVSPKSSWRPSSTSLAARSTPSRPVGSRSSCRANGSRRS